MSPSAKGKSGSTKKRPRKKTPKKTPRKRNPNKARPGNNNNPTGRNNGAHRPHTLSDPEVRAKIIKTVRDYGFYHIAAAKIGVSETIVREWIREGSRALQKVEKRGIPIEEADERTAMLATFFVELSEAEASLHGEILRRNILDSNPRERMRILEKMDRKRFGESRVVDVFVDQKSKEHAESLPSETLQQIASIVISSERKEKKESREDDDAR